MIWLAADWMRLVYCMLHAYTLRSCFAQVARTIDVATRSVYWDAVLSIPGARACSVLPLLTTIATSAPTTPRSATTTACVGVDSQATCAAWASQGFCSGATQAWMLQNCARSCCPAGAAPPTVAPISPIADTAAPVLPRSPATTGLCSGTSFTDSQASCVTWAAQGQCTGAAQAWMLSNCKRSCCSALTGAPASSTASLGPTLAPRQGSAAALSPIATAVPVLPRTPATANSCRGTDSDQANCALWASQGQCTGASRAWMLLNCQLSCCSAAAAATSGPVAATAALTAAPIRSALSPTSTTAPRLATFTVCSGTDLQATCSIWASQALCSGASQAWMLQNCPRSCNPACS